MSGKEKRLIDANEVLGVLADIMRELHTPKDHYDDGYYAGLDRAIEVIEQATTVYPMEELHYPSAEEGPETITLTVDMLPGPMVSDGKGGYVVL